MIVEQIRYFTNEQDRSSALDARRDVDQLRGQLGLPVGRILLADEGLDGPDFIWQCVYEDEGQMASAEVALIGNEEYEAARERLGSIASRVELELYTFDEEGGNA